MNNQQEKNLYIAHQIYDIINHLPHEDYMEILANVFLMLGLRGMQQDQIVTPSNVVEKVMEDLAENGDTIHNSLARQGLTLLAWLNKKRKE